MWAMQKYKATFFLKEPKGDRETPINLFFYWKRTYIKISTGMKAHPKQWNFDKQRVKRGTAYEVIVNKRLDKLANRAAAIFMELVEARTPPTPELLRERLQEQEEAVSAPEPVIAASLSMSV